MTISPSDESPPPRLREMGSFDEEEPLPGGPAADSADVGGRDADSTAGLPETRDFDRDRYLTEREFLELLPRLEAALDKRSPELSDLTHLMAEVFNQSEATGADQEVEALRFGRFRLLEKLGSGSFGIVYLAIDTLLHREVALKLPRLDASEHRDISDRFVREGRAASGLNHPNIVPVYDADERDGRIYIASQYVSGPTLSEWIDAAQQPAEPRMAATLIADLADAVQHAHMARIVHRDIKPSNILLEPRRPIGDEQRDDLASLSDYSARLSDFGVAKFLDQQVGNTQTGELLGTFRYMAPEQAMGRVNEIGPATDIYALGVVLYQLLTLRVPLAGEHDAETLRSICEVEPVLPRRLVTTIPRDLEAICLKCLEKAPARRYTTATALRDDLRKFLAGETTLARPVYAIERTARWVWRNPLPASFLGVTLLFLMALVAGFALHSARLQSALAETDAQRTRAEAGQQQTEQLLYVADMRLAFQSWHSSDLKTLRRQLQKWVPAAEEIDRRGFEWHFLQRPFERAHVRVEGHAGAIYSCAVSPDERTLATVGADGVLRLWDLASRRLLGELVGHEGEINDVAFAADGRTLATTSDDGTARLWDIDNLQLFATLSGHEGSVYGVAFSPNGRWLATGGRDKTIKLWTPAGDPVGSLSAKGIIDHLTFSPDSELLACTVDRNVQLWNVEAQTRKTTINASDYTVSKSTFSPDGLALAIASHDRNVYLWDLAKDRVMDVLIGQGDWNLDVEFSAAGNHIAASNKNGSIRIWELERSPTSSGDLRASESPIVIETNGERAWSCAFIDQGATLVSTGHDGSFDIWPLKRLQGEWLLKRQSLPGVVVAMSRDAKTVCVASRGWLSCWSVASRELLEETKIANGKISCLAAGPNDWWCAGDMAGNLRLWESTLGKSDHILAGNGSAIVVARFSPTGRRLASISVDGVLRVWDTDSDTVIQETKLSEPAPFMLAFSLRGGLVIANGHSLASCDPDSLTEQTRFEPIGRNAVAMAFSPDERLMATGHTDNGIRVWNLDDGQLLGELLGHERLVTSLSFSSDSQTLISSSVDGTLQAWHVPTRQPFGALFANAQSNVLSHYLADDMSCLLATILHSDQSVSVWMYCPDL